MGNGIGKAFQFLIGCLQLGGALLHPVFQLFVELADFRLGPLAFGDIFEHHRRPQQLALFITNRGAGVFHRKICPVLAPKNLIIRPAHLAISGYRMDGALFLRVRGAVNPGMVSNFMVLLAEQFSHFPAYHSRRRRIDESDFPFRIDAKDTLSGEV